MTEDNTANKKDEAAKGQAIMVSYNELVTIRTSLAEIKAAMQAALALAGRVEDHEKRIAKLERNTAYSAGQTRTWKTVGTWMGTAVTSAVGGGALTFILPKLWGG